MAIAPAGIACFVCLVLVLLILRDYPADLALPSYGETTVVAPVPRRSQQNAIMFSLAACASVSCRRVFWVVAGKFFICGFSTSCLVQNHFIALCHDFGMD